MIVIDYRQLLEKIDNPPYTLYSAGDRAAWLDECIATAHAFDSEPVKHGRWIKHRIDDPKSILHGAVKDTTCSVCGKSTPYNTEYCMHCGARMDSDSSI